MTDSSLPIDTDSDSDGDRPEKSLRKLTELMMRGSGFREEKEVEVFGGAVTLVFKPIPDRDYIPMMVALEEHLGIEADDAMGDIEEALADAETTAEVDLSVFDTDFIDLMYEMVRLGIDGEAMGGDEEMVDELLENAVGGYVLEWAFEVMELTGNLMDAKRFRGGRNRE
ncbi:hypothetical protein DU504_11900 [Haloplanus salinus]|jgi:hypothetical protein|uniref:Uncharacterized protein n=1 Tax=Haloplanus salinus TaxID=1126245 RepID=A0A368NE49_9EURY|nr:hypothetical protein [Haloplanus salinus]RCU47935.1 hypothetical protein DU504_11900 [Haloplanus salinus]